MSTSVKSRQASAAGVFAPSAVRPPVSVVKERWAKVIVRVYAVASVLAVALWLLRLVRPSFTHWPTVVLGALNIPLTPSLVSVVALFLLTGALIRRKRIALVLVAVLQLAGLFTSAAILVWASRSDDELNPGTWMARVEVGLEFVGVLVALAALWLTWWVRHAFPARTRHGSGWAAAGTLISGAAASVALTHALLLVTTDTAADDWSVLGAALLRALGVRGGGPRFRHAVPEWIPVLTSLVLALTLIAALYVFLRPSRRNEDWSGENEVAVRRLLAEHGQAASLGYFATRRDKELIFSPNGRAAVAYRVVGAVCLASGDPIGDPASWTRAVTAWKAYVRRYGWVPGVLAASEAGARAYAAAGLAVTALGDEAVLHSNRFSLDNTSLTDVRRAVRRVRRAGLTVQIRRQGELEPIELASLGDLADAWRGGQSDRGFSMALNRWGDPADGRCILVTAHQGDEGTVVGLLSFVPWGRRGLSLDVMRRAPEAPNGTTELMVAAVMEHASTSGIATVSLNFAMLRGVFADAERLGAGGIIRFNSTVLGFFDRFFQLESLYRSNARYHPEWVPRYLCFDGVLALAQVAVAAGRVEGFLPVPLADHPPQQHLSLEELRRVRALDEALPDVRAVGPRRTEQFRHRLRHAQLLAEAGKRPYPVGVAAANSVASLAAGSTPEGSPNVQAQQPSTSQEINPQTSLRVFGRLRRIRRHGGVVFTDLTDAGVTVQAILERQVLGADQLGLLSRALDSGDLVVVSARMGHSRTGTPSLLVRDLTLVAKALHPIPFEGFDNAEARLRQRSTDLLVHPHTMDLLSQRSAAIAAVRRFLAAEGYREVQTPMLTSVHGGASARPFRTYINAYGADLTLRIAPELFLKRLLVAGAGPIFELGRNFRNEGADATHNPEFTSLEAYRPFADYHDMRQLTERLIKAAAIAVHGAPLLPLRDIRNRATAPMLMDVAEPWPVVSMIDAVSRAVGRDVSITTDFEELLSIAAEHRIKIGPGAGAGAVLEELYSELVEPTTIRPTFYIDFPAETSPLTAPHRSQPGLAERWDLVSNGMEIGTAYSELTDPVEQRNRLTEQSLKAAAGDVEAMEVDEDFLYALETGMPPSGGLGIGVDRMVMLLTGTTIREVITFPFARPSRTR